MMWCWGVGIRISWFLRDTKTRRERGKNRESSHSLVHTPRSHRDWCRTRTEAWSQHLNGGIPYEWQEPSYLSNYHCFPGSALSRSWRQESESGVEFRNLILRHRPLNWWAKYPLLHYFFKTFNQTSFQRDFYLQSYWVTPIPELSSAQWSWLCVVFHLSLAVKYQISLLWEVRSHLFIHFLKPKFGCQL